MADAGPAAAYGRREQFLERASPRLCQIRRTTLWRTLQSTPSSPPPYIESTCMSIFLPQIPRLAVLLCSRASSASLCAPRSHHCALTMAARNVEWRYFTEEDKRARRRHEGIPLTDDA